jgi:hypothetical protein
VFEAIASLASEQYVHLLNFFTYAMSLNPENLTGPEIPQSVKDSLNYLGPNLWHPRFSDSLTGSFNKAVEIASHPKP